MSEQNFEAKLAELQTLIAPEFKSDKATQNWCTASCVSRYLRARKLDVKKAFKMLQTTIEWRRSFKPDQIRWEDVKGQAQTGKTFVYHTTDLEGRSIVLMRPRNENSKDTDLQIKFLVYNLEYISWRADRSGQEKMTWLIDFEGYSMSNAPPPRVSIQTLSILQNHYPERLGLAVCFHPPWMFQLTWRAVSPFIDPVTAAKIQFIDKGSKGAAKMPQFFDMSQIETSLGGQSSRTYSVSQYEKEVLEYEQLRAATVNIPS